MIGSNVVIFNNNPIIFNTTCAIATQQHTCWKATLSYLSSPKSALFCAASGESLRKKTTSGAGKPRSGPLHHSMLATCRAIHVSMQLAIAKRIDNLKAASFTCLAAVNATPEYAYLSTTTEVPFESCSRILCLHNLNAGSTFTGTELTQYRRILPTTYTIV